MLHFHIISLFPESIQPYLGSSILGRAQKDRKIKVSFYDPKKFIYPERSRGARVQDVRVDRRPYGGGSGMVLRPEPMLRAVRKAVGKKKAEVIFFSTDGAQLDERMAQKISKSAKKDIVLICGHYEGVDERVAT